MANNRNSLLQAYCRDTDSGESGGEVVQQPLFSTASTPEQYSTEELYVIQEQISPDIKDPVRGITGYHWYYAGDENEQESQQLYLRRPQGAFVKTSEYQIFGSVIKQRINFDKAIIEQQLNKLSMQFDEKQFEQKFAEINEELLQTNDFTYLVLGHNKPTQKLIDSSERPSFSITTKNTYNFYEQAYENKTNFFPTTGLPNYYILNEDHGYRTQGGGEEYKNKDVASYGDLISPTFAGYIKDFSSQQIDAETTNFVSTKMQNILFPHAKMSLYRGMLRSSARDFFPFSVQLQFDTETVGPISRAIKQDDLNDYFLSYIRRLDEQEELENMVFTIKGNNRPLNKRQDIEVLEMSDNRLQSIDDQQEFDDLEDSNICYLDKIEVDNMVPATFHQQQQTLKFSQVVSFQDMLEGKKCYSETLYYKVDKYEIDGENFQKVQSFYLSNTSPISKITILDTQVKHGRKYRYEVFAYKYTLANRYKYQNLRQTPLEQQNNLYNIYDIFITPTPYIVKMLFATIEEVVLDKPVAPPEVEVIPYKDNSEEVSFFFNPSSLQYKLKEYAFTENEARQYSLIRDSQNLAEDELITFGGDDKVEKYYIYRTEKHPTSYYDFKDNLYAIAQTEENCTSAEYLDTLQPNKKYYYIFRAVDVHGHLSPPTDLREIELINEGGTVFLQSKVINFRDLKFQKEEKNVKKYIHIKPSLIQSLIDETVLEIPEGDGVATQQTATDVLDRIRLGNQEVVQENVWDKRFKMRIKSKSTNKFVDIKFRFKTKKERKDV